jgi:hypothetical protein
MGTFLLLCMLGVAAMLVIGVVGSIVGFFVHALFWLITLPFRIVFKIIFGLGGLFLGILFAPFLLVIALIGMVVAVVGGVLSLFAPLVPLVLLGGFGWAIYRLGWKRPAPSPPPPPPGFWS